MQSEKNLRNPTGAIAAFTYFALNLLYAVVLSVGLATLETPDAPIGDPWFTILELLILVLAPALVILFSAIHDETPAAKRSVSRVALVFAGMTAALTSCVHFAVLTLSRHPDFASPEIAARLFAFRWPSLAYALDILAWDVFFAIAALLAAFALPKGRLTSFIRVLLALSGVLALAGLAGVILGDMQIRMIGVAGYVGVFGLASLLLGFRFLGRPNT